MKYLDLYNYLKDIENYTDNEIIICIVFNRGSIIA